MAGGEGGGGRAGRRQQMLSDAPDSWCNWRSRRGRRLGRRREIITAKESMAVVSSLVLAGRNRGWAGSVFNCGGELEKKRFVR